MKRLMLASVVCLGVLGACAQHTDGPSDPKAQKTFEEARQWLKARNTGSAVKSFRKADKQDGGHCRVCQDDIIKYGMEIGDFKDADAAAQEEITEAADPRAAAMAHAQRALLLMREAMAKNKSDLYSEADKEYKAALTAYTNFPDAMFGDGMALARMSKDDAAKEQFEHFLSAVKADSAQRQRAQRYSEHPELARARMAPAFAVTTVDGKHLSLDDLQGKVVLIDFWATWCGPCREALPHIQKIAEKFQGQPLVILSVSLDSDEAKWKDFIVKNNMTWLQYRDGGFTGSVSQLFDVRAIPHTFTIDADGVLQDEHIGDGSIEGKLKKLCAQAKDLEEASRTTAKLGQ